MPGSSLIDHLRRAAEALRSLRTPSIAVGLTCLAMIVVVLLSTGSGEGDWLLMPSFVGLLWAISVYSFVDTFRGVPDKAATTHGFLRRLGRSARRGAYWILGLVFLGATLLALYFTARLVSIWLSEYAG